MPLPLGAVFFYHIPQASPALSSPLSESAPSLRIADSAGTQASSWESSPYIWLDVCGLYFTCTHNPAFSQWRTNVTDWFNSNRNIFIDDFKRLIEIRVYVNYYFMMPGINCPREKTDILSYFHCMVLILGEMLILSLIYRF